MKLKKLKKIINSEVHVREEMGMYNFCLSFPENLYTGFLIGCPDEYMDRKVTGMYTFAGLNGKIIILIESERV